MMWFNARLGQIKGATPGLAESSPTVGETLASRGEPQQLRVDVPTDVTSSFKARLREISPEVLNHHRIDKLIADVVAKHSLVSDKRNNFFGSLFSAKHKESKDAYLKIIEGIKANRELSPEQKLGRFTAETEKYMSKLVQGKSVRYLDNLREAIGMENLKTPAQFEQAWKQQNCNLNEVLCKKMGIESSTVQVQDKRALQANPSIS